MSDNQVKITLKKSLIGRSEKQRKNVAALGISKVNQTVVKPDTPVIRGMINKVSHLVTVE